MASDTTYQQSLNGVAGWLIWPIANFALVIAALLSFIFRHTNNWEAMGVASAAILYCAATLILTVKHAKAARYMFMAFYALVFIIEMFELETTLEFVSKIPALENDLKMRIVGELFRGIIELGTFFYFVFSKRVRQTFTN